MVVKKSRQRNGEIDFLRFLFAVILVLHHSRYLVGDELCLFLGGSLSVEFFFLVSGYLMMSTIERAAPAGEDALSLGKETQRFLTKKILSILPELIVAQTFAWVFTCVTTHATIWGGIRLLIDDLWDLCLFRMTGLLSGKMNGVTWYISSMLICMAALYPLLRKYKDMMVRVILPLAALLGMGFLCQNYGSPRDPSKWIGWTFKGNIRAFAELSLGAVGYYFAGWFSKIPLNKFGKLTVTFMEMICYMSTVYYMYAKKASVMDYFFILLLFLAITITFSGQSLLLNILDNRLSYLLGRFSVCVYLSHVVYAYHLKKVLPVMEEMSTGRQIAIYFVISLLTAVLVSMVAEWVRKNKIPYRIAGLFLERDS